MPQCAITALKFEKLQRRNDINYVVSPKFTRNHVKQLTQKEWPRIVSYFLFAGKKEKKWQKGKLYQMTANSETVSLFVSSFSGLKHSERLRGEELVVLLLLLDNRNGLSLKAKANFQLGKPLRDFWCLAQSFLYLQKNREIEWWFWKLKSKGDFVNFAKKK